MNRIPIEVIRSDIVFHLVESKMWMNIIKLTDKCNPIPRHYMFKVHGMQCECKLQVRRARLKMGYGVQYAMCIFFISADDRATCHEIGCIWLYNNTQDPFVYSFLQCELWQCRATMIPLNDSVLFLFAAWSMINVREFWIENLSFAIMIQFNRTIRITFELLDMKH